MSNGKFTLILDSSQLSDWFHCKEYWRLKHAKNLVPVNFAEDVEAMNAGTYGHALLDIYYRARFRGTSFNEICQEIMAYNPDNQTCACGCAEYTHKPIPGFDIQECSRCKKCAKFRPVPLVLKPENREIVRKRLVDYMAAYQYNDIKPLSDKHTEVGFSEILHEDSENLFVIEGRLDMVAEYQGLSCVADHKFQLSTHWLYPRSVQFKTYAMVANSNLLVINYVRLAKTMTEHTLSRTLVNFTSAEHQQWRARLTRAFFSIKDAIQHPNPGGSFERSWSACQGDYKTYDLQHPRFCWYGDLCEAAYEQTRDLKESQLYKIKENPWKPW